MKKGMIRKVEIAGVNIAKLLVLSNKEKQELLVKIKKGDNEAREKFCSLLFLRSICLKIK